jgi:hypothetical protein
VGGRQEGGREGGHRGGVMRRALYVHRRVMVRSRHPVGNPKRKV